MPFYITHHAIVQRIGTRTRCATLVTLSSGHSTSLTSTKISLKNKNSPTPGVRPRMGRGLLQLIAKMAERRVCVVARHLCSAPTSVTETTAASTLPPVVGGDPRVFATMSNCEDRTGGCDLQKLLPGPLDDERIRKVSR